MTGSFQIFQSRRKAAVSIAFVAFLAIFVISEGIAKWYPYGEKVIHLMAFPSWSKHSILQATPGSGSRISISSGFDFAKSYFKAIWLALVAGLAIAAGIEALVPKDWLRRVINGRASFGRLPIAAGLLAMPCMMCTCCSAPITRSLVKQGSSPASALAFWVGNPILNPAVIIFLALLGPWQWVLIRIVVGGVLVFGGSAVVGRFFSSDNSQPSVNAVDEMRVRNRLSRNKNPAIRFFLSFVSFSLKLIPEYVVLVFLLGVFRSWLFPLFEQNSGIGILLVMGIAIVATLVVIPTAGEIPVLLSLSAVGASPVLVGILLLALPGISLPSMAMVSKGVGLSATLMMATFVALAGILGGLSLAFLPR